MSRENQRLGTDEMVEVWDFRRTTNHFRGTYDPLKKYQGLTNNAGLTFGVGDTTPQFAITNEPNE